MSHTAHDACDIAGITYRQADYWARTGLVRPSITEAHGSGTRRRYSDHDVALLAVISALLDVGAALPHIRPVVPLLAALERREWTGLVFVADGQLWRSLDDMEAAGVTGGQFIDLGRYRDVGRTEVAA